VLTVIARADCGCPRRGIFRYGPARPNRATVALRQIHRPTDDGTQIPALTSRTDLPTGEVCWRLSARWRQENFKLAIHFTARRLAPLDSGASLRRRRGPTPS
jgi:hypothetical protein